MTRDSRGPARGNAAQPRRRWPWLALAAGVLMALPGSWLLAHRLASRDFPPAPWSASELPTIPAAEENGLDDVVLPSGSWNVSNVPEELVPLVAALERQAPAARWALTVAESARLAEWRGVDADTSARAAELAQIDAALGERRFADPCLGVGSECPMMRAINLGRFAALADLDAALRGDWSVALRRALRLLRAANDLIMSARTMLGNSVALVFARIATDHARVVVAGYAAAAEPSAAPGATPSAAQGATSIAERETLDAIASTLSALARDDVDARRALIAECFWIRDGLMPLLDDPTNYPGAGGFLAPYFVDPRGTIAASDERFITLMAWVEAPDHATRAPPVSRSYASGPGWWLWNPAGKSILDIAGVDLTHVITRMDELADTLFVSRDALRRELSALRE